MLRVGGQDVSKPLLTGDGEPLTAILLEPSGAAMFRSADGVLWRGGLNTDLTKPTASLHALHDVSVKYALAQPDELHLVLTPTGKQAGVDGTLRLTRVPLPNSYPLLPRGFHLVNEWGLER